MEVLRLVLVEVASGLLLCELMLLMDGRLSIGDSLHGGADVKLISIFRYIFARQIAHASYCKE